MKGCVELRFTVTVVFHLLCIDKKHHYDFAFGIHAYLCLNHNNQHPILIISNNVDMQGYIYNYSCGTANTYWMLIYCLLMECYLLYPHWKHFNSHTNQCGGYIIHPLFAEGKSKVLAWLVTYPKVLNYLTVS